MGNDTDIIKLIELVKWKKANPEEYAETMKELTIVLKDLNKVMLDAMRD